MKLNSLLLTGLLWLASVAVLPAAEVPKTPAKPNQTILSNEDLKAIDQQVAKLVSQMT